MATTARNCREHLDEEERHHPHPPPPEAESRERVRRERSEEHREEGRCSGDHERVHVPARVRHIERLLLRPHLTRVPAEDPAEVLERHVIRDQLALVSEGRGLNAAETTQTIGNNANRIAARLTR